MRDRLRVAVIGADPKERGFGGRTHVPAVIAAPGMKLAAVCTAHDETAKEAAQKWNVPEWYSDYRDLVENGGVDLVTIAIRVRLHYEVARTALRAGKMVYCEWPLGLNALEARELSRLAEEASVITGVGTQGRFSPGIFYCKELLGDGAIGNPLFFHLTSFLPQFEVGSDRWWYAKEEEASGALYVMTAHVTDVLEFLLGPIVSLRGTTAIHKRRGRFVDTGEPFEWTATDTVSYLCRLEGGSEGTVHVSNAATQRRGFRLDVFGEKGLLVALAPGYVSYTPTRIFRASPGSRELHEIEIPKQFHQVPQLSEDSPAYNLGHALVEFGRAYANQSMFHPSFKDGYRMHKVIEAIARSSKTEEWGVPISGVEGR